MRIEINIEKDGYFVKSEGFLIIEHCFEYSFSFVFFRLFSDGKKWMSPALPSKMIVIPSLGYRKIKKRNTEREISKSRDIKKEESN